MNGNAVTLVGNLTYDPELQFTPGGQATCKLRVASTRFWTSAGEKQEATSFIDVVCWSVVAEHAVESFRKGDTIIVSGRLEEDTWEKDGKRQSQIKIIADDLGASVRWGPVTPYRKNRAATPAAVPFGEEAF